MNFPQHHRSIQKLLKVSVTVLACYRRMGPCAAHQTSPRWARARSWPLLDKYVLGSDPTPITSAGTLGRGQAPSGRRWGRFVTHTSRTCHSVNGKCSWTVTFSFLGEHRTAALGFAPPLPPRPSIALKALSPDGLHNEKRCQSGFH